MYISFSFNKYELMSVCFMCPSLPNLFYFLFFFNAGGFSCTPRHYVISYFHTFNAFMKTYILIKTSGFFVNQHDIINL